MKTIMRSAAMLLILFSQSLLYTEETKELKPELVVNSGHGDHVMKIVFNPDNKLAATMSETAIIIWDVESGRQIKAFRKNRFERPHHDVRFSEDSRYIVFYNRYPHQTDQIVDIIDMQTWENVINIREKEAIPYLAINHDKTMFAYGFEKKVKDYDMKTGKELFSLGGLFSGHKSNVSIITFSPDGSTLASASKDGEVILWDIKNKKMLEMQPSAVPYMSDLLFTEDGESLLIATPVKLIKWDIIEGREENPKYTLNSPEISELIKNRSSILLGDDGLYINSSSSSKLLGIGNMNKKIQKSITVPFDEPEFNQRDVQNLTGISSDVKILAIRLQDNTVMLIDSDSGKKLRALGGLNFTERSSYRFLLPSPDRKIIITGEGGNNYVFRDTATGKQLFSIKPEDNDKPDESEIYFIHDGRVHFPVKKFTHNHYIDTKTWKIESEPLTQLYLPDGRKVLQGGKDSGTGRTLFELRPIQSRYYCVAPDSKYLVQMYMSLEIWDIDEGKIHLKIDKDLPDRKIYRVFSTPDSRRIVIVSRDEADAPEDTIRVWDIETGKLVLTGNFGDRYSHYNDKYMIQFSPDSKYIAIPMEKYTLNDNNNLLVYDFTTWGKLYTLTGYSPVFTSNNTLVVRLNNTISMLDVKTGKTTGNAVFVKDNFAVAATDGRYEAAGEGSGYLHWVSGLEVIPLDRLDKSFQRKQLLAGLFEGAASDLNSNSSAGKKESDSSVDVSKQLIGRVGALNGNDIIVNSSRAAQLIRMGDKLFLIVNGKKIFIEAVFPMMTTARCKALKQSQIKEIKKGMPVFR